MICKSVGHICHPLSKRVYYSSAWVIRLLFKISLYHKRKLCHLRKVVWRGRCLSRSALQHGSIGLSYQGTESGARRRTDSQGLCTDHPMSPENLWRSLGLRRGTLYVLYGCKYLILFPPQTEESGGNPTRTLAKVSPNPLPQLFLQEAQYYKIPLKGFWETSAKAACGSLN